MNPKKILTVIVGAAACFLPVQNAFTADENSEIGIVSFNQCIEESKIGKDEQSSFEAMRKQMEEVLDNTQKELSELSGKYQDPDYHDSLSPEAEEDLRVKLQTLSQEMAKYENQYYQTLNAAKAKLFDSVNVMINKASESIAKKKNLKIVLNDYTVFFHTPALNITDSVIDEMDALYETERQNNKKN